MNVTVVTVVTVRPIAASSHDDDAARSPEQADAERSEAKKKILLPRGLLLFCNRRNEKTLLYGRKEKQKSKGPGDTLKEAL